MASHWSKSVRLAASVVILTAGGVVPSFAQVGSLPNATPPKGTAVLRGHVFDAQNGRPLRRALVRSMAPDARTNSSTLTDDQGAYEFRELPAGHYVLTASKTNFVSAQYGQSRQSEAGKTVILLDGQTAEKLDVTLSRTGVIAGHVVDEYGDPAPNVQVTAMRSQFIRGRKRLMPGQNASTDDLGEYRISGLGPADYYVSANVRSLPTAAAADEDAPGYAVTYFPGTANAADAQKVTIGVGTTVDQIDVALVPVKTAQISGSVIDGHGQPMAGGNLSLTERGGIAGTQSGTQIRPDGTFVVRNVAPGEYVLRAQTPFRRGQPQTMQTAMTVVSVAGHNVDGIQIVATELSTVSGIVLLDPTASGSSKLSMSVRIVATDPDMSYVVDDTGRVNDDLTFEARAQAGRNAIQLFNVPTGSVVRSVRVGGVDVSDSGFEVKANERLTGVEVELTNHPTSVSGVVTDGRGMPTSSGSVVVFAQDELKWEALNSRYVRLTRPDQDGKFNVHGLPPGDYFAAVSETVLQPDSVLDPDVLKSLEAHGVRVSLSEGETKSVDMKAATP
ncbi:MAG TPA: carboxypeptidase-like regulatory domain-containing protein [Vicinamibacterales bacterium]